MKIRNKLSLLFTVLTAAILSVFASTIYYSAYKSRELEFYNRLRKEALTKANLFFKTKIESKALQTIYRNNREIINEVEVAIYDSEFHLLYHDALEIDFVKENRAMINEVLSKQQIQFYQNDWQVVGLNYHYRDKTYILIAAAFDQYGFKKLTDLGKTIVFVFVLSVAFIYLTGQFFSKKALAPIVSMNQNAKEITATNLDLRIDTHGKDELAELGKTFNDMLERLEQSFDAQKEFVSNISHELRTPLATIITELQLAENKERSIDEYQLVIKNALQDAQRLAKLSNSLLDFAKASYDTSEISFKELRLDEVLLDAQQQLMKQHPQYKISISFVNEAEEETLVNGNEYLLKTAFLNLIENACKFSSDQHCQVQIAREQHLSIIHFRDQGVGISAEDLSFIFTPFYRGANGLQAEGNGIGLSLTKKIIELHQGTISVQSSPGSGTTFTLRVPSLEA